MVLKTTCLKMYGALGVEGSVLGGSAGSAQTGARVAHTPNVPRNRCVFSNNSARFQYSCDGNDYTCDHK
eukprot:1958734-Amphidinium_carterae.1